MPLTILLIYTDLATEVLKTALLAHLCNLSNPLSMTELVKLPELVLGLFNSQFMLKVLQVNTDSIHMPGIPTEIPMEGGGARIADLITTALMVIRTQVNLLTAATQQETSVQADPTTATQQEASVQVDLIDARPYDGPEVRASTSE